MHGNRVHRRSGPVAGDVEQVDREAVGVEEAVAEDVAAQARGRQQDPLGADRALRDGRRAAASIT